MLEQSIPDARAQKHVGCTATRDYDVGHIRLGEHRFRIVLASAAARHASRERISLFEINGQQLAAIAETAPATGTDSDADQLVARLTGRELQIAVLVAQGHATKNIAYRLQISEWTVSTYLRRIFAKLNVESRAAMVYRCASLITASLTPP
jgi:DNA-binding CsgD family transcriptional regulator